MAAERARLAAEIHDTLAQGFTSIVTLVQAAESELDGDRDEGAAAPGAGRPHRAGEPRRGAGAGGRPDALGDGHRVAGRRDPPPARAARRGDADQGELPGGGRERRAADRAGGRAAARGAGVADQRAQALRRVRGVDLLAGQRIRGDPAGRRRRGRVRHRRGRPTGSGCSACGRGPPRSAAPCPSTVEHQERRSSWRCRVDPGHAGRRPPGGPGGAARDAGGRAGPDGRRRGRLRRGGGRAGAAWPRRT